MSLSIRTYGTQLIQEIKDGWMGIHLVLGVALASRFLHGMIAYPVLAKTISEILLAVVLGLYIGNMFTLSQQVRVGVKFAMQTILRLGIILLGLRLSLQDFAATGISALLLVLVCIGSILVLSHFIGKLFRVPPRLAALIGVGTAICGNTAIIATAPVLDVDEEEMGFAVATITLFGLLAVLVYPLIGQWLGLSDRAFGLWAGTAVNDTSQVVAVSAIYSEAALNVATIVKLTRNTLMAPLIVLFGVIHSRVAKRTISEEAAQAARRHWTEFIPGFVIGFALMAIVRTVGIAAGILPQNVAQPGNLQAAADLLTGIDELSKFFILIALAGVGLNTNLGSLRRIGLKPLLVGTFLAVVLAAISLGLILYSPLGA